jgi:hypothetical protein
VRTPFHPVEVTSKWLTAVLRAAEVLPGSGARVKTLETQPVDEDRQVTGQIVRVNLTYDPAETNGPRSLVAKFSSPEPQTRALFHSMGFYEREVRFYQQIAPRVQLRTPRCFYSALETTSGRSLLILEDLGFAGNAGLVAGCSPAQAELGVRAICSLHAAWWQHPYIGKMDWLRLGSILSPEQAPVAFRQAWQPFLDKLSPQVRSEAQPAGAWLNLHLGDLLRYMYQDQPYTLIHNDYHADNLVFVDHGRTPAVAVLDWQLSTYGHGVLDVASLLGNLNPVDRHAHEWRLLQIYHSLLTDSGIRDYSFHQCWTDYRLALFYTISRISTAVGLGGIPPTRERQLCDVVFSRYSRAVRDLESYGATETILKG